MVSLLYQVLSVFIVAPILNSTDLVIGFEFDTYRFHEPPFEIDSEAAQSVSLVKNIITELTYFVVLQIENSVPNTTFQIAEKGQDYNLQNISFPAEFTFLPDQQRLQIFNESNVLTLIADKQPEGPEAFRLTVNTTSRGNIPHFSPPIPGIGISSALIIILDDESRFVDCISL